MKIKSFLIVMIMLLAMGAAGFAQNAEAPRGQRVTVEGTLQLQNGFVVLVSGGGSYFVPWLLHYAGFIDGIKEGATISVEGYVAGYNRLMPASFTVNGKTYDLARPGNTGRQGRRGFGAGGFGGHCGDWDDDDWDDHHRYRRNDRRGERGRHR